MFLCLHFCCLEKKKVTKRADVDSISDDSNGKPAKPDPKPDNKEEIPGGQKNEPPANEKSNAKDAKKVEETTFLVRLF